MKVVLPGGSGHVGGLLRDAFQKLGAEVVVVSRTPSPGPGRHVFWDGATLGPWTKEVDGADVIVNLAGRSVNCRYTPANRHAILQSRVITTQLVGEAIAAASRPPSVWLQSSTATIYAHRLDAANDEATGIIGGAEAGVPKSWHHSIDVARAWEAEVDKANTPQTRKLKLRSAMIMSPDRGGIFDTLLGLVRRGLGGTAADGKQYISWIHEEDFVNSVHWLIERSDISGAVNLAAPTPLPNAEFMRDLRRAWGTKVGLPASRWMLTVGAALMGTETELILKSRRVIPGLLTAGGFAFHYPTWPEAAGDLCERWRAQLR